MNNTDLPPLPATPVRSPEVCEVVSLYLAVSHDITEEQKRRVSAHLQICPQCVHEYHLVRRSAQLVNSLEGSEPSARVDIAVMAAIAARTGASAGRMATITESSLITPKSLRPTVAAFNKNNGRTRRRRGVPTGSLVAAAAVLVVAFVGLMHFIIMPPSTAGAFQVPANAWNGVLYHTQTVVSSTGDQYHVTTYHDMTTDDMNVETTMGNELDVMVVSNGQKTVGMDMKHDVTQANASAWLSDDSMFDVKALNADLKAHPNHYLGEGQFNGQTVYRILDDNGDIILLDMQFKPVNVLQNTHGTSAGTPMYDKMQLLNQAPPGTWDINPPTGFKVGELPAKP
jgi:hypothetical protein